MLPQEYPAKFCHKDIEEADMKIPVQE